MLVRVGSSLKLRRGSNHGGTEDTEERQRIGREVESAELGSVNPGYEIGIEGMEIEVI